MANIQIRIDNEEKAKAQAVLESMGLSLSGAIKLFLRKIVAEQRIPFEISATKIKKQSIEKIKTDPDPMLAQKNKESFGNFQSHRIE